jgi:hypothetical protein
MAQTTRCYNQITVGTLSSHRSRRRNGEESCEEGRWRQEEGREEAVRPHGGVQWTPPSFCTQLARLSRRREAGTRGEGIRQQPGRVPGGSSQVLARMTRSHTHTDERGDSHGKESSQGREEEGGRKEAVSAATRSPWGAKVCAPVFFCTSPATARRPRRAPAAPRPTDAAARRLPSR